MRRALTTIAVLTLMAGNGCASEKNSADTKERPSRSSDTPTALALDPTASALVGRYAHYDVVAYEGDGLKNLIISYGFTDLTAKDGKLWAKESFCHADQRSDQPIETSISDAATSAIKPVPTPVTVSVKDGKVTLARPETPTGIGIHLEDPANDKLPTDPSDPRVADDDHDGKPGITVRIKVSEDFQGELYIARREIFAYNVEKQDDASLVGTVSDRSEQLVVGATDEVFNRTANWAQHPDLTKSPIVLVPVKGTWDCTRLMASRDDLFPPAPVVDW